MLGGQNGQSGDDLLDVEDVAHHQPVDIGVRVEGHQVAERHVVAVGDAVVGVALDHSVGGLAGGVGLQRLLDLADAHQGIHRVDRRDGQVLHKFHRGGGVSDILGLDAVQHGVEGGLVLHHADDLTAQHDLIGPQLVAELIELAVEEVADVLLPAQVAFQGEGKGVIDFAAHPVVVAQQLAASGLDRVNGLIHHALVRDNAHLLAVHNDGVAGGVEGGQGEGGAQRPGDQQKGDRSHRQRSGGGAVKQMGPPAEMDAGPFPHALEIDLPFRCGGLLRLALLRRLRLLRRFRLLGGFGALLLQLRHREPGGPALILGLIHGNHLLF